MAGTSPAMTLVSAAPQRARGPAWSRRAPRGKYQPACKPGSGGHRLLAQPIRGGHSSGTTFARCLKQPTRTAGLTSPCGVIAASSELSAMPSLFGFAPGGVYHAVAVAGNAVRSYRTFSPLPRPQTWRVAPAGRYPAPYVDGARTFLPGDLSVLAGAAARPTDGLRMKARRAPSTRLSRLLGISACWDQATAALGRPASSACKVATVEVSAMPSTFCGRKWR